MHKVWWSLKVNHCNLMHHIPHQWKTPLILSVISEVCLEQKWGHDYEKKSLHYQFSFPSLFKSQNLEGCFYQHITNTFFAKDKLKVSQGQPSEAGKVLVYIAQQIHTRCSRNCIRLLCSGTSVAVCWWSLTDGCSLFFYMAVRKHTSHLFHIVAGV